MGPGSIADWLKVATVFGMAGLAMASLAAPVPAFDIVSHARTPLGVMLAVLGLLHLPAGRWRWGVVALVSAAFMLAPSAGFVTTPRQRIADHGRHVRVLFHNAWMRNEDPTRVLKLIRDTRPDVVGLIEVRRDWHEALEGLSDLYPYRVMEPRYGETVIFSRWPLQPAGARGDGASLVFATVNAPGRDFEIAVTHFTRPWPWDGPRAQRGQLMRFAEAWRTNGEADIVVGDFNGAPWSPPLKALSRATGLRPAYGPGGTWPTFLPALLRLPIDNALVGPRVRYITRSVQGPTGSDHAPVLYDVVLED